MVAGHSAFKVKITLNMFTFEQNQSSLDSSKYSNIPYFGSSKSRKSSKKNSCNKITTLSRVVTINVNITNARYKIFKDDNLKDFKVSAWNKVDEFYVFNRLI